MFLNAIGDALQLERLGIKDWSTAKTMITPAAVRKINEAIVRLWPPTTDIDGALQRADKRQVAFYSGDYRPEKLLNAIGRHLVYADVVALADPFIYPFSLKEEYNPLLHPAMHVTNTARNAYVWLSLAPMITAGLVEIVRLPSDFDPRLNMENLRAVEDLHERHPNLMEIIREYSRHRASDDNDENAEWMMLLQPDSLLRKTLREAEPSMSDTNVEIAIQHIHRRRKEHPFYIRAGNEFVAETTGSSIYDSIQVARLSGGYLLTDLEPRWKQLEFVQKDLGEALDDRTLVAHSLENLSLPMAAHFDLGLAQRIRDEGQLERVRGLLDQLMRSAASDQPLSEKDARAFQHELTDAIAEAKDEYAAIDRDLLKTAGAEALGLAGLYSLTSTALTVSLGAAVLAGAANLVVSQWQRRTFKDRFPAGMFLNVPTK